MKLSSGPARVADIRRAGVNVGLGSAGEKENNTRAQAAAEELFERRRALS